MTFRKLINRLGYHIVRPLGLVHFGYRVKAQLLPRSRELRQFRNAYEGKRCFILGNGPSLKKIDPSHLANEITFTSNRIYLADDWLGFNPTFYAVEDVLVLEQFGHEIGTKIKSTKFYSTEYQHLLPRSPLDVNLNIIRDYTPYSGFPIFSHDAEKCVWVGGTISYIHMQLAYYMGFKKVYLIGFDHNYGSNNLGRITGTNVVQSTAHDEAHFTSNYCGAGVKFYDPSLAQMEAAYLRAKETFERAGRGIFNATVGGYLEVFPRVDYRALFEDLEEGTA